MVRLIGAEGLGLLELVNPITMLIFTLVGSGVPIAVIRLTTQATAKNNMGHSFKIVDYVSWIMVVLSLLLSITLFSGTPFIANNILRDERLVTPLYIFAPAIIIPSLSAIFRGHFYGTKNVVPPALSQLIEQVARMLIVLTLLRILYPFQEDKAISISMVGSIFGELAGFLVLLLFYRRVKGAELGPQPMEGLSFIPTLGRFSTIALPITFSRVISSLLRTATSIIVPGRLLASGLDRSAALSCFGRVNGMAIPLLFLPFTLTSSLVLNMIPRISEAVEQGNRLVVRLYLEKTIHLAFLIGIPLSGIFYLFSDPIFTLLYGEANGTILSQLSIATLFLCTYQISTSILQAIGKQWTSTLIFVGGMLIQFALTYVLVSVPEYRVNGYILSYLISYFLISAANLILVFFFTRNPMDVKKYILIPCLAAIIPLSFSKPLFNYLLAGLPMIFSLLTVVSVIGVIYLGILLLCKNIQYFYRKGAL